MALIPNAVNFCEYDQLVIPVRKSIGIPVLKQIMTVLLLYLSFDFQVISVICSFEIYFHDNEIIFEGISHTKFKFIRSIFTFILHSTLTAKNNKHIHLNLPKRIVHFGDKVNLSKKNSLIKK